jgi:hypothetical protein
MLLDLSAHRFLRSFATLPRSATPTGWRSVASAVSSQRLTALNVIRPLAMIAAPQRRQLQRRV